MVIIHTTVEHVLGFPLSLLLISLSVLHKLSYPVLPMQSLSLSLTITTGGEIHTSFLTSTTHDGVFNVPAIGRECIKRQLKSRRRASQLCLSFPCLSDDCQSSPCSLPQQPLQQSNHSIFLESKPHLSKVLIQDERFIIEVEKASTECNFERKASNSPVFWCPTPQNYQPHERSILRCSNTRWRQPKVTTEFMEGDSAFLRQG